MIFYIVLAALILIVIFIFSSKKLSPVPYFPSQPIDLPKIVNALNLKNNQTIVDLGAGDGMIIFAGANQALDKKLNTQFVGVEINPILVLIMSIRSLFHPNRGNIKIVRKDMFKHDFMNFINFKDSITLYLYISPWYLEKTILNVKNSLVQAGRISKFSVVSYMYQIPSLRKKEKTIRGKNSIFVYR